MSDRDGGIGMFLLGVAMGALLGLVLAPGSGEETRTQLSRRMRNLRDLAEEKVDEVRDLVLGGDDEDHEDEEADPDDEPSTREQVRRRLSQAKQRRRGQQARGADGAAEEDDPVA